MDLARSVGLALMVVLDRLSPAERLAFVLHDIFGMTFEEIAPIADRSVDATRQLARRARRRVRGKPPVFDRHMRRRREVIDAFLTATRAGDLDALVAILDPDVVVRGVGPDMQGANLVAERAIKTGARAAQPALIDGQVDVVVAPRGKLTMVLRFTIDDGRITAIDAIRDPQHMQISVI